VTGPDGSLDAGADPDAALQVLLRWEASGAHWRVLRRSPEGLLISLLTCTGDEEMGRLSSVDADLLAYVGDRDADDG
jgi:hypothetical protein